MASGEFRIWSETQHHTQGLLLASSGPGMDADKYTTIRGMFHHIGDGDLG